MSVRAMTWALEQRVGEAKRKLILIALADFADEHGCCYPAQATLAEMAECSVDTVQRGLKKLEAMGLISRERRHSKTGNRSTDHYRLSIQSLSRNLRPRGPKPKPQSAALSKPQMDAALTKPQMDAVAKSLTASSEPSVVSREEERESPRTTTVPPSREVAAPARDELLGQLASRLQAVPASQTLTAAHAGKIIASLAGDFGETIVEQAVGRLKSRTLDGGAVNKPARLLQLICEDIQRERRQRCANPHASHGISRFGG